MVLISKPSKVFNYYKKLCCWYFRKIIYNKRIGDFYEEN
jgi:hypothetical protein